jgi:class 3 adenylate cyclase
MLMTQSVTQASEMAVCAVCGQESPDGFRLCGMWGRRRRSQSGAKSAKVVTVLFADLVGFSSRTEQLDPTRIA